MFDHKIYEENLKSKVFGRSFKYFKKIKSTNDEAKNNLNAVHGHLIFTNNQTDGKGRRNNKWFSLPNKSLTFSIMLNKNEIINKDILPLLTSVAIVKAFKKKININCKIKWPNDIMLNDKKIGGVLIESKSNYYIVGIGLNINHQENEFNGDISKIATSIYIHTKTKLKLEKLLANIVNEFELTIKKDKKNILEFWLDKCNHLNKSIKFHRKGKLVSGKFMGINKNGEALIKMNKKITNISSGAIYT